MSANAPAGNANKNSGAFSAVCISATIQGDGARVVINQSAPTLCIHVPMFDATLASQIARNKGLDSGCHADVGALSFRALTLVAS
jgi:hypothetical protein